MTADPRTLATNLEEFTAWYRDNPEPGIPGVVPPLIRSAGLVIRSVVVPLHDTWLQVEPPCATCDGNGWTAEQINDRCDARQVQCPDCPASPGVQPFDKWTAELINGLVDAKNVAPYYKEEAF